jgi:transcriptional regulator with XRE-family HTH domain
VKWTDQQLAERIKKLRTSRKLTQEELTKKLAAEGISIVPAQLARLEKGTRSLRVVEAAALCNIFDVSMDTLAGVESSPEMDLRRAINGLRIALDTREVSATMRALAEAAEYLADVDTDGVAASLVAASERACVAGRAAEQAMRDIQATLDEEGP